MAKKPETVVAVDAVLQTPRRRGKMFMRLLVLFVVSGLIAGLGFATWKYSDKLLNMLPFWKSDVTARDDVSLIPYCDALSRNVYALKLDHGYGEMLPVLHETGGQLVQCGEGAENGFGRIALRQGKAYYFLPKKP